MRTEPKAKEHVIRYCLPDSSLLLSYNPETSSRVTLASLCIVFQTALTVLTRLWLARQVQNLSRIKSGCDGFVLSRIFIVLLDFSAPVGRWDFHGLTLAGGILRRTGANTIRSKSNTK